MATTDAQKLVLHRFAVIAEAIDPHLSPTERGAAVRSIAGRSHQHPDGSARRYSRSTVDRFIRAYQAKGLVGLLPLSRSDTGAIRAHPELFEEAAALRLELPSRSATQIASILFHRHGVKVAERTISGQLARRGLARSALSAEPKAFGRYEAERANERWITDVLVGPFVPFPKAAGSVRARLFIIVDDHSRLVVQGRFFAHENARSAQECLRAAIVRRGLPTVLYADYADIWIMPMFSETTCSTRVRAVDLSA